MGNAKTEREKRRRMRRAMGLPKGAQIPAPARPQRTPRHHYLDDLACPECGTDSSVGCLRALGEDA